MFLNDTLPNVHATLPLKCVFKSRHQAGMKCEFMVHFQALLVDSELWAWFEFLLLEYKSNSRTKRRQDCNDRTNDSD
jgi:hypothetical protein